MRIKIVQFSSSLGVKDVFLNDKLVGVVGVSGGFTYLSSTKVTPQEDEAIMEGLRLFSKNN
jgi:hypothetical protein